MQASATTTATATAASPAEQEAGSSTKRADHAPPAAARHATFELAWIAAAKFAGPPSLSAHADLRVAVVAAPGAARNAAPKHGNGEATVRCSAA